MNLGSYFQLLLMIFVINLFSFNAFAFPFFHKKEVPTCTTKKWVPKIFQEVNGRKVVVVMIPGLASESLSGKIYAKTHGSLFGNFKEYLNKRCIENRVIHYNTQASPTKTIPVIKDQITELIKKDYAIILVGHSKGALDSMTMMIEDNSGIKERVKGIVSLGNPFQGSPFVDFTLRHSVTRMVAKGVFKISGGDSGCLISLSQKERLNFKIKNQYKIKDLVEKTPFVAVAGELKKNKGVYVVPEYIMKREMSRVPGKEMEFCDGIVPESSALSMLDGLSDEKKEQRELIVENVKHRDMIFKKGGIDTTVISEIFGKLDKQY